MLLQSIVTQGWRRLAQTAIGLGMAAALAACGGGGGSAGTPVIGPGSGASAPSNSASAVAADLVVVLSKSTMTNSGSDSITATVTSIDANRVAIGGVPVTFTADANAVVTAAGTATDSTTGVLTASITQGADATVRPVTVTVKSGSISRPVTFNIVQTPSSTNPQASDLTLVLNASSIGNTGSKTVTATATAVDQNRNALSGIPVQLSVSDPSAFIVSSSNATNASGQVSGTVNIGEDRSNRTINVVATSGALTRTAAFQVTGARFEQASAVPAVVQAGAAGTVEYKLSDENTNAMPGVTINVSGAGIASATGKTDLNGRYTYNYTAPNAPGTNLVIKAIAGGVDSIVTVPIPNGSSTGVDPAQEPNAKTLNLSADVVTVNTANTSNQITVNASFRTKDNAPIPNMRVLFGVTGDNGTGKIGSGGNTVLSDASGTASTSYAPGSVSSPTNGVSILACWKTGDFVAGATAANCAASGGTLMTASLTIVSNPVSISIGTDNTITSGASGLTYIKKYVVLVVDSAGNPKSDVQITPSLDLGGYGKGYWQWNPGSKRWERRPEVGTEGLLAETCPNEDLNRNGVIDDGSNPENINGNNQLDPRKSDVAITLFGATKTDANGTAILQVEYPKNFGSWVRYKITVTAAGVLSRPANYPFGESVALPSKSWSELGGSDASVRNYLYTYDWLPVQAESLTTESPPPPFVNSPYGVKASCASTQ
jgi:hypothetical protein